MQNTKGLCGKYCLLVLEYDAIWWFLLIIFIVWFNNGCMSVSIYNLNCKSSRVLYELRTELFGDLKSGLYRLSQK